MAFTCSVCGDSFATFTREHFIVLGRPLCICNRCAEVIWAAYMDVQREAKSYRREMREQVSQRILFSDLDEDTKAFLLRILDAYATDDDDDRNSSEIRGVMDALFFEPNYDKKVLTDWIKLGEFSEVDKKYFFKFLERKDPKIIEIMEMIDGYGMADKFDEDIESAETCEAEEDDEDFYDEEEYDWRPTNTTPSPVVKTSENRDVKMPVQENRNMKEIISDVLTAIKCQDRGVIQIGYLINRHLMRLLYNANHPDKPLQAKQNILVIGPTGVGKTATIREYCRILDIPCVEVDMTDITKVGYIGANLVDSFRRLVNVAEGNIEWAQKGVMILDEGDKNLKADEADGKDPGGKSVMFELLKKLEGGDIALGGGKYFNTKDLLFVCMGTFESAYKAREERLGSQKKTLGFGAADKISNKVITNQPTRFIAEDLKKGGAPAEWIGRFPIIVEFDKLTTEGYITVLHDSRNSIFLETKKLLEYSYNGLELIITPEGEKKIAEQAHKYNVGVRGLNRAVTELLEEVEAKLIMQEGTYKKVIIGESVTYE